jgi:opacity protein-like surface antigen
MPSFRGAAALSLALAALPAQAQTLAQAQTADPARDGWRFALTPYVWLAGFSGDLTVRDRSLGDVSASTTSGFDDVLDSIRFAFMGTFEARRGRLGLLVDLMTLSLEQSIDTPRDRAFSGGNAEVSGTQLGAAALLRVVETPGFDLDLGAGLRAWWAETTLTLDPGLRQGGRASADAQFTDPLLALRAELRLAERWSLRAYGDIGGFGAGSDLTWQAFAAVSWRATETLVLQVGYRHLAVDFSNGDKRLDIAIGGPIIGLSWSF